MFAMKFLTVVAVLASGVLAQGAGECVSVASTVTVTVTASDCGPSMLPPPPPLVTTVEPTGSDPILPHPIESTGVPPMVTPGEPYGTTPIPLPSQSTINGNSSMPGSGTLPSTTLDELHSSTTTETPLVATTNGAILPTALAGLGPLVAAGVMINAVIGG